MTDIPAPISKMPIPRRSFASGIGISLFSIGVGANAAAAAPSKSAGRFAFAPADVPEGFLLDGKPFQIRAGELHPARIPAEYWSHRIRMAKAMGLNAIAIYLMWNYHEVEPGRFDFTTGNRDIAGFLRLCAQEDMIVFLRPGPYVCAEWDLGGIPPYLLRNPDADLRRREDRAFMVASARYIARLAAIVRPFMFESGGPIAMVQVENEYASFGADLTYMKEVQAMWEREGISGPFSTSDGLKQLLDARTHLPGVAIGLNGDTDFKTAQAIAPDVPVWVTEGYSGWITHWGDPKFSKKNYSDTLRMLMRERRSFNIYVVHGGTNFGFTAGANARADGSKFEPSLTSYDYGAPINECGLPTVQYDEMRRIIHDAIAASPPPIPEAPARIAFPSVTTKPRGSLWQALPQPRRIANPAPMELVSNQTQGMILYRHMLAPDASGMLWIEGLHDEALVLLDSSPIARLSRLTAVKTTDNVMIAPGQGKKPRQLDILVYAFGRVNYGQFTHDRKGIVGGVKLAGKTLRDWDAFPLPLDGAHLDRITAAPTQANGLVHEASVRLDRTGDTFIDMRGWPLGFVWVNGHLLGRHCALGPQTRLYCPASFLKRGENRITILDLHAKAGLPISGADKSDSMVESG